MKSCQWCENAFVARVKYQIYCSDSCREGATKQKIADRYAIARRTRLMSKTRLCASCKLPLSAYNDEEVCQACLVNPKDVKKALKEIKSISRGGGRNE
jgi:hypothetical protein